MNYPVEPYAVKADGNCLPHCGSILAFGNENNDTEIRTRIVTDLIENEDLYLDQEYLRIGINKTDREVRRLPGEYAMFSEHFVDQNMTKEKVREIYRKEILDVRNKGLSMGIWQIFSLANILKCREQYTRSIHCQKHCIVLCGQPRGST